MKKINITIELDKATIDELWRFNYDENDIVNLIRNSFEEHIKTIQKTQLDYLQNPNLDASSRTSKVQRQQDRIYILYHMLDAVTSANFCSQKEKRRLTQKAFDEVLKAKGQFIKEINHRNLAEEY